MEMIDLATLASALNVVILAALIYVYARNYLKLKSNFGLGLMLFASLLLLHNLAAVYFQVMMIMYYTTEVAGFAFVLNVLEALGLSILAYISLR
ncbi:MAG TPA: hypothetical protein VLD37_02700 [Candidatus Bilamarchaeum sp.]|nr:hypothetical protein [Candidatus Bilamarchaeum sp.]